MIIRRFGWRDLPLLYSYRNRGLFLDSVRVLLHGPEIIPLGAFIPFLGPINRIYTYRCDNSSQDGKPIIGQVTYAKRSTFARLSFLAPENAMDAVDLSLLADYMAVQMGEQGAFHILAEVDEASPVYPLLRRAGFAIYARQRIWQLEGQPSGEAEVVNWSACRSGDIIGARSLYCNVVPGLVQQVEPLPKKKLKGYVHYQRDELSAYIELKYGQRGIWVQPYIHPDTEKFERKLAHLFRNLPGRRDRPLYICIRSYQSWFESALEALGARPGARQAVMVRHLTLVQRVKQTFPVHAINGTHAEPTAPIARIDDVQLLERQDIEKHPRTDSI